MTYRIKTRKSWPSPGNSEPDPPASQPLDVRDAHEPAYAARLDGARLSQISIVEPGHLACLSGQTATPLGGGNLPSELAEQARIVADNLAIALKELGASPADVVHLPIYVVNATTDRFEEAWAPIRDMLSGELPSMTGVGAQAPWTAAVQLKIEMIVRLSAPTQ